MQIDSKVLVTYLASLGGFTIIGTVRIFSGFHILHFLQDISYVCHNFFHSKSVGD